MAADGSATAGRAGLVPFETTQKSPRKLWRFKRIITKDEQAAMRVTRMRKNVITSARLHVEAGRTGGFRGRWAMLTLTYREDVRWIANQVASLLDHLRKYATRAGFVARYVWVLELTKRLRPHYHVLVWLPKGRSLPKPDKQGWWPHGMTKIEWAKNAVGYLAKYASKADPESQIAMPKGARLSGVGGLVKEQRIELRWWKSPLWVREVFSSICDLGKPPGGGWVNRETGEFLPSPWRCFFFGGSLNLCEVVA
jgi:hypothetical protein